MNKHANLITFTKNNLDIFIQIVSIDIEANN